MNIFSGGSRRWTRSGGGFSRGLNLIVLSRRSGFRGSTKQIVHRLVKALAIANSVLRGEDNEAEFGHWTTFGFQVNGFYIQQRTADGNHQQVATHDLRALLIPQRELRRELRVLIDPGVDLQGPVDES